MDQINQPLLSTVSETNVLGSFVVEPLHPGYGSTLGNALRRVLLSSLEGAAVDYVTIEGVQHEFSTIPHVKEDVVQILLNLKMLRFKLFADTAELTLAVSKPGVITGANFEANADCEVVSTDQVIATLDEDASVTMRIGVKRGRGYEAIERKTDRSKEVGVITTDSIFSPIVSVAYRVENTRVGQMTNYDKLLLDIKTDGSIMPSVAMQQAASILAQQYAAIAGADVATFMEAVEDDTEADEQMGEQIIVGDNELDILQELDPKTKIEDAGFTGRTAHALLAAGYKTLSGLKRLSDIKLQSIAGLGKKGFEEVKAVLSRVA